MKKIKITKAEALNYHSNKKPGKIEIGITKPCFTQKDLSLAYTPGVAEPCREIFKNPEDAWKYTSKGNLVAVISNGTAVLGLGNIGPLAGKPVMEGKGVLFKKFAGIDVFDIEIEESDPIKLVEIVKSLEPTFGGINLEDIKAPECFYIEQELIKRMSIPVFHDDQHGTAIIVASGLINALELVKKDIGKIKVVFSGAGAAATSCAKHILKFGVKKENVWMIDKNGLLNKNRTDLTKDSEQFLQNSPNISLSKALEDADVFIGLSVGNILKKEDIKKMSKNPIIFAMANPDPEILPEDVVSVRADAIVATGRSDYPNQINNVLGFPFIFRGALDVRATRINDEMKMAASLSLASLAKENVTPSVKKAYRNNNIKFGRDYIIPKPLDSRILLWEAPAVAKAAMSSGVAKVQIKNLEQYKKELKKRI